MGEGAKRFSMAHFGQHTLLASLQSSQGADSPAQKLPPLFGGLGPNRWLGGLVDGFSLCPQEPGGQIQVQAANLNQPIRGKLLDLDPPDLLHGRRTVEIGPQTSAATNHGFLVTALAIWVGRLVLGGLDWRLGSEGVVSHLPFTRTRVSNSRTTHPSHQLVNMHPNRNFPLDYVHGVSVSK